MGAQGVALLDFGVFPGASDVSLDVATAGVVAGSQVEAWIQPADTADHTADEHVAETLKVFGRYKTDGTITITGINTNQLNEPLEQMCGPDGISARSQLVGGKGTSLYGKWTVGWVWN